MHITELTVQWVDCYTTTTKSNNQKRKKSPRNCIFHCHCHYEYEVKNLILMPCTARRVLIWPVSTLFRLRPVGNLLPSSYLGKALDVQRSLAQFSVPAECPSVLAYLDNQIIVGEWSWCWQVPMVDLGLMKQVHLLPWNLRSLTPLSLFISFFAFLSLFALCFHCLSALPAISFEFVSITSLTSQ